MFDIDDMTDVDMDSSDSMSDFEDIDVSSEDIEAIARLEKELSDNPNLYDKNIEVHAITCTK